MIRLEMKKYITKLTEKQQKYDNHLEKLIDVNFLQKKKYRHLIKLE